jgi:Fe-S oxidoreductase
MIDRSKDIITKYKSKIKLAMSVCARCGMCAESCFLYMAKDKDPEYMPSYKMINSIGYIVKKKGKLNVEELERVKEIVWDRCVLCTRCYCSLGIDIPWLISLARDFCRANGVFKTYDN